MSRIAVIALLVAGCTQRNEAFCCTSAEDCVAHGLSEDHLECNPGLACVDNLCTSVSCITDSCSAAAPTCDFSVDECTGCTSSGDCTRFPTMSMCEPASGACVECLSSSDCSTATPVCDPNACRACSADPECASGACAEDGTCVPEANAVYLSPIGVDAAPCSHAAPCKDPRFAFSQTSSQRPHIIFAKDLYSLSDGFLWAVSATGTSAGAVFIHGNGAKLVANAGDGFLVLNMPTVLRGLEIVNNISGARAITATSTVRIEDVVAHGAVESSGAVTLKNVTVERGDGNGCAIGLSGGSLTIDRAIVLGGSHGICSSGSSFVTLSNLLVNATNDAGLDLTGAMGTVQFTTVTATGFASSGTMGILCSNSLSISSSIVWTPNSTGRPAIAGPCTVTSSIVGPSGFPGGMNVDPLFANPATFDFHLAMGSPAIDAIDHGPPTDFEGQARPQGVRFDLGADERP